MSDQDQVGSEFGETVEGDENADGALMIDESAFGIWVSWYDAEDVELSQSADRFPPRIVVFRSAVSDFLERESLGKDVCALDFGTSVYIEVGDGDHIADLLGWVKRLRVFLLEGDWLTFVVVSHGGRWVASAEDGVCMRDRVGDVQVLASFGPSEPFKKVMAADVWAHDDEQLEMEGWGVGMFVEDTVLEALGRRLKNEPTAMWAGGGKFYRLGG